MRRRQLLRAATAVLAASPLQGLGATLEQLAAQSGSSGDYKALVGVFLYGGMDCHDTVIPYDEGAYRRWAEIRSPLVTAYAGDRDRRHLLPIGSASATGVAREVALAPEFKGIHTLFSQGQAAVIGNIGPLLAPTDSSAFSATSVPLPNHLFSHNDQQSTWMSGASEGAGYGWAGRIADAMIGEYGSTPFGGVSADGSSLWVAGRQTFPFTITAQGAAQLPLVAQARGSLATLLTRHFSGAGFAGEHVLGRDMAHMMAQSTAVNASFDQALKALQPLTTTFPDSGLGGQLAAIADAIAIRQETGAQRQVFVAGMGGFDTHDNQAERLPALQQEIDSAVSAFMAAIKELGLDDSVTLFTASDFGRTLAVNGDGTDHGWGGHHFVVGGAVDGGKVYGEVPEADFGHGQDAGSGRLIPGVGVAQLGAALAAWFGVSETVLPDIFPELAGLDEPLALFG